MFVEPTTRLWPGKSSIVRWPNNEIVDETGSRKQIMVSEEHFVEVVCLSQIGGNYFALYLAACTPPSMTLYFHI